MAVVGLSEKCRCCPGRKIADDNSPCHPLPVNSVMATCHRSRWAAGSEDKGVLMLGRGGSQSAVNLYDGLVGYFPKKIPDNRTGGDLT